MCVSECTSVKWILNEAGKTTAIALMVTNNIFVLRVLCVKCEMQKKNEEEDETKQIYTNRHSSQ